MSSTLQVTAEEIRKWLEEETASLLEPLRERGSGMLLDLKSKFDEVEGISARLFEDAEKEMRRGDSKTYHASRAASRLSRNLSEKIGKIAIPKMISYQSLHSLDGELREMLTSIGMERRRWFKHIEPYFIMNRRRLDTGLRKIVDSTEKIQGFLSRDYTKAKIVEDVFGEVDNFLQSLNESNELTELEKQDVLQTKTLDERIVEDQQKVASVQNQKEAHDLVEINIRIEELTKKVRHILHHLQKPLFKLQSLMREGEVQADLAETKKLDDLLNDPFEALATEEEGCPLIKAILQKMKETMAEGKLKLKISRLRKAQEQVDGMFLNKALSTLCQECEKARNVRERLLTSEAIAKFQKELVQFETDLKDLKAQRDLASSRIANVKEEQLKKLQRIQSQKRALENDILELTGKKIEIIVKG